MAKLNRHAGEPNLSGQKKCSLCVCIGVGAFPAVMILCLRLLGRVWWCAEGDWAAWSWDVWSPHNSQHLIDPYSLSHVEHGIGLYLLLSIVGGMIGDRVGRQRLSPNGTLLIVAMVEAIWEVAENTPFMIERYREATISLDYYGDSILNSCSDYTMCLIGVMISRTLKWPIAIGLFALLETVSILWIRDSLLLNIVMLVCPIDTLRQWQTSINRSC